MDDETALSGDWTPTPGRRLWNAFSVLNIEGGLRTQGGATLALKL